MITLAFWFVLCLLLSAFFSASEMSFVSADKVALRKLADSDHGNAKTVLKLHQESRYFLTTLLICNNVVNIAATTLFTCLLQMGLGFRSEWLVTVLLTPILLVGCEFIPKDYARIRGQGFLLFYARILRALEVAFHYATGWMLRWVDLFLSPLGPNETKSIFVNEREFRSIIEETVKTGAVTHHEMKIINTILDFERVRVREVMVPVQEVPQLEIQAHVGDAKKIAKETGTRMILIYEEDPSIVVGMIYVYDLLFEDASEKTLRSFLRSPIFIPEHTSNERAFFMLQQKRQSYAVVINAHQDVCGVVAIERLLSF